MLGKIKLPERMASGNSEEPGFGDHVGRSTGNHSRENAFVHGSGRESFTTFALVAAFLVMVLVGGSARLDRDGASESYAADSSDSWFSEPRRAPASNNAAVTAKVDRALRAGPRSPSPAAQTPPRALPAAFEERAESEPASTIDVVHWRKPPASPSPPLDTPYDDARRVGAEPIVTENPYGFAAAEPAH